MVQFQATLGQPYEYPNLKNGSKDAPSLAFANAQTTGFYLESGNGVGVTSDLVIGENGRVVAEDLGDTAYVGLQGDGGLDALQITHHKSGRVWRSHSVPNGRYYNIIWVEDLGLFVTTNSTTGHVVTSKDGETWTASSVGVTARDIAWSPTLRLLVGVGIDSVWTSPDAVTWTQQTTPMGDWYSVTWAPSANAFVAIFGTPTQTMTSPDGITWTLSETTLESGVSILGANDTTIIIVTSSSYRNYFYTSTDGHTWTQRKYITGNMFADSNLAYSDSLKAWISINSQSDPTVVISYDDGLTWDFYSLPGSARTIAWCDTQFVAVGQGFSITSPDGIEWTTHPNVLPNKWLSLAWSPTLQKVAMVGWNTSALYTSDARTSVEVPKGDITVRGTLTSGTRVTRTVVTNLTITDASWTPIDDTALPSNGTGYLEITGLDFQTTGTTRADIGGTPVTSISVVDSTTIRITAPPKPTGTYTLRIFHPDGSTSRLDEAVTYSTEPVWSSSGSILTTTANGMPFDVVVASSDSTLALTSANVTVPPGTTIQSEGNVVTFSGIIGPPQTTSDTVFGFDASVTDVENQDLGTKSWTVQHAATYHSQYMGNAVVQSFTTASDSATIDASGDTLTDTTGTIVAASTATGSTAVTAAGHVLDGDASSHWTTAATYDATDGSYIGAVSTTVGGNALRGEYIDLALAEAQTVTHLAIRPLDGSTAAVPVTFTVAGSHGGTWTLVHTQASAVPLADGTETVVALDTPGAYSSYRLIAQTVGVGEDSAKIAGLRTWADGLPLLDYAHPITLVNGHVMARVGTTAMVIDPSVARATTIAVGLTPTAKPALLADGTVFWPPAVGYTIGYRIAVDGTVTTVSGIAADVSNAVLQADGTVLMLPSNGTTAQTYDPSSGAVANVTAYSLPGSEAILEPAAVPGGVLALPKKAASGSLIQNGTATTTTALFGANYNESKLVASDVQADARFGYSCSMNASGDRVVIGAFLDDATGGTDSGAAYVFSLVDGVWVEDTKLIPSDSEGGAGFGISCSMSASGDRVIIGAYLDDATGGTDSGAAYVFSHVDGSWVEDTKLIPSDSEGSARFGNSVSINTAGNRVVIGAYWDNETGGSISGAAYVFSLADDGSWEEDSKIVPNDSKADARFGFSCSMNASGDRVVIGAHFDNATGGSESGAAYVFSLVNGVWVENTKLIPSDSEGNARFGTNCSINESGDRVVIGAREDNATGGTNSGAAYVFSSVDGSWVEDTKLIPSDSEANALFGSSCNMNASGDRVVIGAREDNATGGTNSGAAYVFSLVDGSWVEDAKLIPNDSEGNARFGESVSMSSDGSRVVIGSYLKDENALTDAGAAYVYDLSSAGQLVASGNAVVAKGSTMKAYDLDGDTVTATGTLPNTISDLTILDDGRVLATSAHDTAMTYDPATGFITSVQGPRALGRATRLLDGKVWTEGGVVFQSGSSVQTPLTATIGLSSFVNP